MPFKRLTIKSNMWPKKPCSDLAHNPPLDEMLKLAAGTYEYECPTCGHKQICTVPAWE